MQETLPVAIQQQDRGMEVAIGGPLYLQKVPVENGLQCLVGTILGPDTPVEVVERLRKFFGESHSP